MAKQLSEAEVKARVRELRKFYIDLTLYGTVNLGLVLIWAISGGGYFWPIWVIVGWGIGMALNAISLGMIPAIVDLFPFFDKTWEEQQIKRMMKETITPTSSGSSSSQAPLKAPIAVSSKPAIKAPVVVPAKKASAPKKPKASTKISPQKTPPTKK
ncbi:MAG: hypothetical protein BGO77_00845 [Caedibacter sp. 37-49]|nr:MAG: hypothetical protein BGO77_00845 [Caedibacter sp. 37-49]